MFKSVASTGANVDPEFYDELQSRVATLLELDQGKVKKSMEEGTDTPGGLQELGKKTEIATQMVQHAQATGQIAPSPIGPAPGSSSSAPPAPTGSQSVVNSPKAAKKRTQLPARKKSQPTRQQRGR